MNRTHSIFRRRSRGMASIFAISLIILVGTTLAVLGTALVSEAKRTAMEAQQAQLRQLLIAGAAAATKDPQSRQVMVPRLDQAAGVTLVSQVTDGVATVSIVGNLGERQTEQTIHLKRDVDRWVIVDARLAS